MEIMALAAIVTRAGSLAVSIAPAVLPVVLAVTKPHVLAATEALMSRPRHGTLLVQAGIDRDGTPNVDGHSKTNLEASPPLRR